MARCAQRVETHADPMLVLRTIQIFDCIDVRSTGDRVLRYDVRISCDHTPEYAGFRDAAVAFVTLFCLGFPIIVGIALVFSADRLVLRGGDPDAPVLLAASDVNVVVKHVSAAWAIFSRTAPHGPSGRRNAIVPPATRMPALRPGRARKDSVIAGGDRAGNGAVLRRLFDCAYGFLVNEANTEVFLLGNFKVQHCLFTNADAAP